MRNLATLLFAEALQQQLLKMLNDSRPRQSAGDAPQWPAMGTQDIPSSMDILMSALDVLIATHRDLREWSDPQMAARPEQFAFQSDALREGLEEADLVLVPRSAVQRLLAQSMDKNSRLARLPKVTDLSGIEDYRQAHAFGFIVPRLQSVACAREHWEALLDVSWHALDNHIGLLGTIGLQLALIDPRKETASRLMALISGLATMCPDLSIMHSVSPRALEQSDVLNHVQAMCSAFRAWHATVVKTWDVSHTYLLPEISVQGVVPAAQANTGLTVPRSLEKSLFPDELRVALHRGASQILGADAQGGGSRQGQTSDDLSTHLRTAQNLLYTYNKRYQAAGKLQIKRPEEVINNAALANFASEEGLVMLPSKPVLELLQVLHKKEGAMYQPFPKLDRQHPMWYLLKKHPFGVELMHNGVSLVACRPGVWQEQLRLMQATLQHHVGILVGIGFKLALKDRGEAARQGLQSMLAELSSIVDLADVRRTLEDGSNSSKPLDTLEAAYAKFTHWFLDVLSASEVSSRVQPLPSGQIDAPQGAGSVTEVSSMAQAELPTWTESELIQLLSQKPSSELGELSKLLQPDRTTGLEADVVSEAQDGLLPERILAATSLPDSPLETELSDGLLPLSRTDIMAQTAPAGAPASTPTRALTPTSQSAIESAPRKSPVPLARSDISGSATLAPDATIGKSVKICAGARVQSRACIGDGVTIGPNAVIGERSIVEHGARIGASVKLPAYVRVASGVKIESLDLRSNVRLAQGTILHGNVTCYTNVVLKQACQLGANVEIASSICVDDAVNFSGGAKVGSWKVPKGTRGLTAAGSLVVERNAQLGKNVTVGANVLIHEDAIVGDGARLGNHVKVGAGKRVGAGAQIADGLEVFADVPAGAIVGDNGTTPDGSCYAHMIRPFTLTKGGAPQSHNPVATVPASIAPSAAEPEAPARQSTETDTVSSCAMQTEVLVLSPSAGRTPNLQSAPVSAATPPQLLARAPASKRADTRVPSQKKKPGKPEATPEAGTVATQSALSATVEERANTRQDAARTTRPTTRSMSREYVRNLPSISREDAELLKHVKRSSTVAELPELPSKKRHKPEVVSASPAIGESRPALPVPRKPSAEKAIRKPQEAPQPTRTDFLLSSVAGTPQPPARSRVTVPSASAVVALPSPAVPPAANVVLSRSNEGYRPTASKRKI